MQISRIGLFLMTLMTILVIAACSQSASQPEQQKQEPTGEEQKEENTDAIVLRLGHGTATDSLYHEGSVKFKEIVEEKTGGQVKVELFPDGQLGHDRDLTEGMNLGTIEMGMIGVEPLTTMAPKLKAINLPFLFTDRDTAYAVLDGEIGEEMVEELPTNHGIRVLGFFENGFRHISNSKQEINTPEDLQGLAIRTPESPVSLAIFQALGANPTPMSFGELYTALEQGTVDGQENPVSLIYTAKLFEVQDYVSLTGHMYSPMVLTISEKKWSTLSPELQAAVQEAAAEAKAYERQLSEKQEGEYIANLKEAGVIISEPDVTLFVDATKDVHQEFDDEYGAAFYQKLLEATQ